MDAYRLVQEGESSWMGSAWGPRRYIPKRKNHFQRQCHQTLRFLRMVIRVWTFELHGTWLNLTSDQSPSIIIDETVLVHGRCNSGWLRSGNWITASEGGCALHHWRHLVWIKDAEDFGIDVGCHIGDLTTFVWERWDVAPAPFISFDGARGLSFCLFALRLKVIDMWSVFRWRTCGPNMRQNWGQNPQ